MSDPSQDPKPNPPLDREAKRRLAVIRHVEEVSGNVAQSCRYFGISRQAYYICIHPELLALGSIPHLRDEDGRPGQVNSYRHLVGDYVRAALSAGLQLRRCEEPVSAATPREASNESADAPELGELGPWDMWPWTLLELLPEAARAASAGMPGMLAWHFQAPES